jgi:two-component system OmpR family sensor kinase
MVESPDATSPADPIRVSFEVAGRRAAGPRLFLRLYAIGIATAIAFAATWFAAHTLVHLDWPGGVKLALETLRGIPAHWEDGTLPGELDRMRRSAGVRVSAYDVRGTLLATNVQPPFEAPSEAARQRTASGEIRSLGYRPSLTAIRRGDRLLGFCVFDPEPSPPPLWGVIMDLLLLSFLFSVVGLLLWRVLVRPLQRITAAAQAFGEGDMSARTGVDRKDEIGNLARSFDEMSERIARSREAERELLASLSHELRTPMARIRVALDLAAESDAETARTSLTDVAEDLTELETLMANIFSTTRLEMAALARDNQPVPLQRGQVDVAALLEKAVAHQGAQHPQRAYILHVGVSGARGSICADAIFIRRAIENVLDNAHKYSPGDLPVTISVDEVDKSLRVVVTDRGVGIGPDDLPRVFSPFFRADRSRTRATGGVGLGLALAKRVVEAHGGSIRVASQVDVGTTVTFLLPIAEAPDQVGSATSAQ